VPAARALARELSIDLSGVEPTGPDRTITKSDVERAAQVPAGAAHGAELKGVRRAMALNMARSGSEVVPATIVDEADVSAWPQGADVTIRLIRAVVAGCRTSPALNAWYDGRTLVRQIHDKIDLGVAVDTEDGLFVPVLRDVANRDAADLRRGLEAMKADLLARKVPLSELRGQTITLSNFGMLAGRFGGLVVVPPQVAILGAGRMAPRVVAIDEQPAVHRTLPLSLTFDHRAVTGAEAARFLRAALGDLQRPE
jgi:pyruvate dehydrogenase E2 component (dihydrolipoamide acetyltransferase)